MWIYAVYNNVFGLKLTGDDPRFVGTRHLAVAVVLDTGRPGTPFAGGLGKGSSGQIDAAHVFHVVEPQLQVRLGTQQSRVLVNQVDVLVDYRYVGTPQCIGVGRGGNVEKVERTCPFLSLPDQAGGESQQY